MSFSSTLLRRLLPALLLSSLALASCSKDCDPKPKRKCGSTTTTPNN